MQPTTTFVVQMHTCDSMYQSISALIEGSDSLSSASCPGFCRSMAALVGRVASWIYHCVSCAIVGDMTHAEPQPPR